MHTSTLVFAFLTLCLAGVAFHAWRLGNEKRDVALLGVFSGILGVLVPLWKTRGQPAVVEPT